MSLLLEATFKNALPKIKVGDILEITNMNEKLYSLITHVSSFELTTKNKDGEFLLKGNPLNGDELTYYKKNNDDKYTLKGKIQDIKQIRVIRNNEAIEWINNNEDEKDNLDKEKKISNNVNNQKERLVTILSDIKSLTVGDNLVITTGLTDKNGEINESTQTKLTFVLVMEKNNKFYLDYVKSKGANSEMYNIFNKIKDLYISEKSVIVTSNDDYFSLKFFSKSGNKLLKNILHLTSIDVDNSEQISKDDILNNPIYLKAMQTDASFLRKLFGSNIPTGVIPALNLLNKNKSKKENSENSKLKPGSKIQFRLLEDVTLDGIGLDSENSRVGKLDKELNIKVKLTNKQKGVIWEANIEFISELPHYKNVWLTNITIYKLLVNGGTIIKEKTDKDIKIKIKNYNF